jgi:hypothetical protein
MTDAENDNVEKGKNGGRRSKDTASVYCALFSVTA